MRLSLLDFALVGAALFIAVIAERRWRALRREMGAHAATAAALRDSNATLRSLVDDSPTAIIALDGDSRVRVWNAAAQRLLGWSEGEILGQPFALLTETAAPAAPTGESRVIDFETRCPRRDGSFVDVRLSIAAVRDGAGGLVATIADITEQHQLQEKLRLSQRLEAVGRLAGGVAHDFNNLLTAIRGHAELLLDELPAEDVHREDVVEIQRGAERAATLTRQLLAFSRRQMLQPKLLDLNQVVDEMDKMLRRLVGEDIRFRTHLDPALAPVLADPGQVEQVLANLVVNARDAMPDGGELTIETANVEIDENAAARHAPIAVQTGSYVMIAVSDTGTGMDEQTRRHIFEPFFTTKEIGKGTGLGLATVYGIVKQSGGYIWVYSEPGQGSVFKIYLPKAAETVRADAPPSAQSLDAGAGETILLVEDEELVRALARKVLLKHGYSVIEARDGVEALRLAARHHDPIHLLLTDVVMPEMGGRQLADRLTEIRPATRVVYMSGYTDRDIVQRGIVDPGKAFLQKPFAADTLLRMVRRTLDDGDDHR